MILPILFSGLKYSRPKSLDCHTALPSRHGYQEEACIFVHRFASVERERDERIAIVHVVCAFLACCCSVDHARRLQEVILVLLLLQEEVASVEQLLIDIVVMLEVLYVALEKNGNPTATSVFGFSRKSSDSLPVKLRMSAFKHARLNALISFSSFNIGSGQGSTDKTEVAKKAMPRRQVRRCGKVDIVMRNQSSGWAGGKQDGRVNVCALSMVWQRTISQTAAA